jgi:hypothetical protein
MFHSGSSDEAVTASNAGLRDVAHSQISLRRPAESGTLVSMAKQPRNLMDELGADLLPEPEFRTIVAAHFPEIAQSDHKVTTYSRNGDTAILARYKDGALTRLEAGPALSPEDIEAVASRIRAEAAETREHVHRSVVFSIRRAAGFWRFGDRFQLLPAPPGAPDVPGLAPHPLVLEFKVRHSADLALSTMRWTGTQTRLVLLLNALLRFGLTHAGFRSRPHWVTTMEWPAGQGGPGTTRTTYANTGYVIPDFIANADDFTDTSDLPQIPAMAAGEPHSVDFGAPLQIPSYLAPGVACYYALTGTDRDAFHRSLYWFAHAHSVYPTSSSAAFAALVQAIEVLAGQPGPRDPCPHCQHDRSPGPTARFRDLLASVGVDRRTSGTFYQIRSGILHGSRVLVDDIDGPFSLGLDPGSFEFYTSYDTCEDAARFAMLTWLQRHASTAT